MLTFLNKTKSNKQDRFKTNTHFLCGTIHKRNHTTTTWRYNTTSSFRSEERLHIGKHWVTTLAKI